MSDESKIDPEKIQEKIQDLNGDIEFHTAQIEQAVKEKISLSLELIQAKSEELEA